MELKKFEKILKNNGYIEEYYDIIFKLLLDENFKNNGADRTEIFNTIKELKFYSYDYTWHLKDNGKSTLYNNLFEINKFVKLNQAETGCDIFLKNNLFPILKAESDYFFTKKSMIYKEYDDETDSSRDIHIKFLSPLFLYNLLLVNDLFINDINSLILDKLTSIEDSYFNNIKHPIIKDGIDILNESLEKPEKFENFVLFWSESPRPR